MVVIALWAVGSVNALEECTERVVNGALNCVINKVVSVSWNCTFTAATYNALHECLDDFVLDVRDADNNLNCKPAANQRAKADTVVAAINTANNVVCTSPCTKPAEIQNWYWSTVPYYSPCDGVSAVAPGLLTVAAAFIASKFL